MKKVVIIIVSIIIIILIWKWCTPDKNKIDECLDNKKGCIVTGEEGYFLNEDYFNGLEFLKNETNKPYPYGLRNEKELKTSCMYFDVSAGLQPGVAKFTSFITAFGNYMAGSELEIYKSSFQDAQGKVYDKPMLQNSSLNSIVTEMQDVRTYKAPFSFLQGTVKKIVSEPTKMSVFFTDWLLDEGKGNGTALDGGKTMVDCHLGESGFSWCDDYFVTWFQSGGQIIVVTQQAPVNKNPNGNIYAIIFIPKGRDITQLKESLRSAGIKDEDVSIFNPLGLDLDLSELVKMQKEDDEALTIIKSGPGYVVIGSENEVLSEMEGRKLKMKLIDQTGMAFKWNLQVSEALDYHGEIKSAIGNKEPQTVKLHKNERVQGTSPIAATADASGVSLTFSTIPNQGENDIIFRKFVVKINGDLELDASKFETKVLTYNTAKRKGAGMQLNQTLRYALEKALVRGAGSVRDKNYAETPLFTIYTVVNVTKN